MTVSPILHQLYLRTLTPFEIKELRKVKAYNCSDHRFNTYLHYWISVVSKFKSMGDFKAYCHHTGIEQGDIRKMLSTIEICPEDARYPRWIKSLQIIIDDFVNPDGINCASGHSFLLLFEPFLSYFAIELRNGFELLDQSTFDMKLIQRLQYQLYRQLFNISKHVLDHKIKSSVPSPLQFEGVCNHSQEQKFIQSVLEDKYRSFFIEYPMLARKLATTTNKYIDAVRTLISRFFNDKTEIEYTFNRKLTSIYQLHLGQGDFHNGEATVIIEFKDHSKLVYKPRNVSITLAYNAFLDWVGEQLNESLLSFQVIDKGVYGWLEFIDHTECKNDEEANKYFEKAGILLGVTYFLNSIDCHYENLIATGACPIIIDHETMLSPKIKKSHSKKDKLQTAQHNILTDSVLTSMLLPNSIDKTRAFASGFGSSISAPSKVIDGLSTIGNVQNKPILEGKALNPFEYQKAFKKGFQKLFQLVNSKKEYLLSESSILTAFREKEIRFMNRPTNVYYQIMKSLRNVKYLSDATRYGLRLEILSRAFLKASNWSSILSSERIQMLKGDIPFFTIDASANCLTLPGGEQIDIIEKNAFENIVRKVQIADKTNYENQLNLLEESILL